MLCVNSVLLVRFVTVLLKRIDSVLLSALLAHLDVNFRAINAQIKRCVLIACCLCVLFPSFLMKRRHSFLLTCVNIKIRKNVMSTNMKTMIFTSFLCIFAK